MRESRDDEIVEQPTRFSLPPVFVLQRFCLALTNNIIYIACFANSKDIASRDPGARINCSHKTIVEPGRKPSLNVVYLMRDPNKG